MAEEAPTSPLGYVVNIFKVWGTSHWASFGLYWSTDSHYSQIIVALSPLIILAYILFTAFESDEAENRKRKKKGFELEGHAE